MSLPVHQPFTAPGTGVRRGRGAKGPWGRGFKIANRCCVAAWVGLVAAGCANPPPGVGYEAVQEQVGRRLPDQQLYWNRNGDPSESKLDQRVNALLDEQLTANQAVQVALLNNADLQATYEDLGIARADLVQAGLLENPVLDGEFKFIELGSGPVYDLGVAQNFLQALFIPARRAIEKARFKAVQSQVTGEVLGLAGRTRLAVIHLQADRQLVDLFQTVVHATKASYETAQRMREAGNITKLERDREQALYEQARQHLVQAKVGVRQSRAELNALMGLWANQRERWQVAGRLPDLPDEAFAGEHLTQRTLKHSVDLAEARRRLAALGRSLGLVRSTSVFRQVDAGAAAEGEGANNWAVGPSISLEIPLFRFGQAAVPRARARMRQAYDRYTALAVNIRNELVRLRDQLSLTRDRVEHYQKTLMPLRQAILNQSQRQNNAMQIGVFKLLQAKRRQIDTAQQSIHALENYWQYRAHLKLLLAGRMTKANDQSRVGVNP